MVRSCNTVAGTSVCSENGSAFPQSGLTLALCSAMRSEIDQLIISDPCLSGSDTYESGDRGGQRTDRAGQIGRGDGSGQRQEAAWGKESRIPHINIGSGFCRRYPVQKLRCHIQRKSVTSKVACHDSKMPFLGCNSQLILVYSL